MGITRSEPPAGGQQRILTALGRRLPRQTLLMGMVGGARPSIAAPLPIYNLRLDEIADQDFLKKAKLVGWRYPVIGGQEAGLAHLSTERDGAQYEGLTKGDIPERLVDAANLADGQLGKSSQNYEARLLQVPALKIMALWMAGEKNKFVLIADGHPPEKSAPLRVLDDLRPVIAEAKGSERPTAKAPAGSGPSNGD